jgi:hypothetical protein
MHFYNTRDVLPRCAPNDPGEKVSCWPAPEYARWQPCRLPQNKINDSN